MSPRSADPAVRDALLAAGARLLATEGPHALSTRRLAAEVGVSTMAVYTRFGSMDLLRREIRRDGFDRLEARLDAVAQTDDPVADLAAALGVYLDAALESPALYRALMIDRPPEDDDDAGAGVFDRLVTAVRRCADAGRFELDQAAVVTAGAAEFWVTGHGMVTLAVSGVVGIDQVRSLLLDMTYRLAVGFGDDPAAARRSIESTAHHTIRKGHDDAPPLHA